MPTRETRFRKGMRTAGRTLRIFILLCVVWPLSGAVLTPRSDASGGLGSDHLELAAAIDSLERRILVVERQAVTVDSLYSAEFKALVRTLARSGKQERSHMERIATALIREGRRSGIDTRLLLGVMLVENPWLDPVAVSPVGAMGLMQVMPFHAGKWGCGGDDLTDIDVNICHGVKILAHAIRRSRGDLDTALLRYNGCVRGTNTPDCHLYPSWVHQKQTRIE